MNKLTCNHTNAFCLDCFKVEKEMLRIGAFIMCEKCATINGFGTYYDPDSKQYKKWLDKYKFWWDEHEKF